MSMQQSEACVGVLFYNEIDGLKRLIPSLLEAGVPSRDIFAFDGPFDLYPHNGETKSTDGSLEYLEEIRVNIIPCGVLTHIDKCNERFKVAAALGYKMVFAIDCDEYMLGSWPGMLKHLKFCTDRMRWPTYAVPFMDLDDFYKDRATHQRILLDPTNLYFRGTHWWLFHNSDPIQQWTHWTVGAISVIHDSTIRPISREKLTEGFQEKLVKSEEELENIPPYTPFIQDRKVCGCQYGFWKEQQIGDNAYKIKDLSTLCDLHK